MTELVINRGRYSRTHNVQFKRDLVEQCVKPGISLANVA
jgi:hypothetical protein